MNKGKDNNYTSVDAPNDRLSALNPDFDDQDDDEDLEEYADDDTHESRSDLIEKSNYTSTSDDMINNAQTLYIKPEDEDFGLTPEKFKCRDLNINRKSLAVGAQIFVVFCLVSAYFGYKLGQYYDVKTNRNEYTRTDVVDEMMIPYIYLDFYNYTSSCEVQYFFNFPGNGNNGTHIHAYFDGTGMQTMTSTNWSRNNYDPWDHSQFYYYFYNDINTTDNIEIRNYGYTNSSMSDTDLTNTMIKEATKSDFMLLFNPRGHYEQYLLIPPSDIFISVGEKENLQVDLVCYSYDPTYVFYKLGHEDEILMQDNINTADLILDSLFWDSNPIEPNYKLTISYTWYSHNNKVDISSDIPQDEKNDYFIGSVEGTYSADDYYSMQLDIQPNPSGSKITYVTEELFSIYEVFSLSGGMFATVNSFCTFVVIYLIWGFDFGCLKFKGLYFVFF